MKYRYSTPITMPRGTHYGNNYIIAMSRKLRRKIAAFSNLEYDNLVSLEMNPDVEWYCEQPCKKEVNIDGQNHSTVFDVYVLYKNGKEEFQEVKYASSIQGLSDDSERTAKQISIQKTWCSQNNMPYSIRTDKDIYLGQYHMRNLHYLFAKARRFQSSDTVSEKHLVKFLADRGQTSVGLLVNNGIISAQSGIDFLADLYYKGIIDFSNLRDECFSYKTEVIIREQ